jgi:hypothetical protein
MVPLNPLNNIQRIFLWDNGIESFQYAYFFWLAFYYLFSLIGISAFITQKILLVLLLIIGFTFTYLSYKELFRDTKYSDAKLAFLAAVIFTFNPIYFLLVNAYLPLYGFPVCFYLLIKFLQKGKILYAILFSILLNFFFFTDLPQPKLLIVFGIACLFLALLYRQMRTISFKDISIRLIIIFSLSILLNLWVLIPLLHSMFFGIGATFSRNLVTYGGDADFKTAAVLYIARFFNYSIIKYYPHLKHFLIGYIFCCKRQKRPKNNLYPVNNNTLFYIYSQGVKSSFRTTLSICNYSFSVSQNIQNKLFCYYRGGSVLCIFIFHFDILSV